MSDSTRQLRGMTQNYLGQKAVFSAESADARIAQYENYSRNPTKKEILDQLSIALGVSPHAIKVPDIDSYIGLMHTLFAIQDIYGLKVDDKDDEICLRLDKSKGQMYVNMFQMLNEWKEQQAKYESVKSLKRSMITGAIIILKATLNKKKKVYLNSFKKSSDRPLFFVC